MRKHWNKGHYRGVKCFFNQKAHKQIRKEKRADKAAAVSPRPVGKLRPMVHCMTRRYANKMKLGRGFSLAELKEAKLTPAFAQSVGIAVDHRRHNKNKDTMEMNVKRLASFKDKVILFPAGKTAKKGEIPDSNATADVEQTEKPSIFGESAWKKTGQEYAAITDAMKKAKVYQKLRAERINKYYDGKRKEKARKAEAAKQ